MITPQDQSVPPTGGTKDPSADLLPDALAAISFARRSVRTFLAQRGLEGDNLLNAASDAIAVYSRRHGKAEAMRALPAIVAKLAELRLTRLEEAYAESLGADDKAAARGDA